MLWQKKIHTTSSLLLLLMSVLIGGFNWQLSAVANETNTSGIKQTENTNRLSGLPVVVTMKFQVMPSKRDEFMRLMAETAKKARAEPGILSYEFYEENNVPNSFLVFIELLTKEDLVEHLESDYGQTFKATVPQLIVRNGDTRIFSISQLDFVLGF